MDDLRTIFRIMPARRRRDLLLVSILMPLTAGAEMIMVAAIVPVLAILGGSSKQLPILPALLGWIERISPASPLVAAAVLFVVAAMATAGLRLLLSWATLLFAARFGHDLNMAIQHRLLHQPYLFHVSSHSSRLLASLGKVDYLVLDLAQRGLQGIGAAIISLAVIAALLQVDPLCAAAAAMLVALLYGAISLLVWRRLAASTSFMASAYDRRIQLIQENLGGIRDIIIDQSQPAHLAAFAAVDERFMLVRAEASFLSGAPRFLVEGIGLCLIALLGLYLATRPGGLPAALPVIGALTLGAQRLLPLNSQIYNAWISLSSSRPILSDVAAILRLPVEEAREPVGELPFQKSISFDQVGLHYHGRPKPALNGVNLLIPRASRVAIVGKS
ncbi:MAG: ABC transporter transmembrane domain-containing protein, partial [Sphingomicrobium sp.]